MLLDAVTIIDGKIFKCEQCGECCRHIDFLPCMKEYDIGNGVCKYLLNNKCIIYNERPNVCRGEYLYHLCYEGMPVDEYYKLLHNYCNLIRGGFFYAKRLCKNV